MMQVFKIRALLAVSVAVALGACGGGDAAMKSGGETTATALAHPAAVAVNDDYVYNGSVWKDTAGATLQSRAVSVFSHNGKYYMVGEDKSHGATFTAVACYSSDNLTQWKRETNALEVDPAPAPGSAQEDLMANKIIERPRVLFNDATQTFVMYMHVENIPGGYGAARIGIASSTTPCGPYQYLGSQRPLGNPSRDIGLFKDDDGKGYLLSEMRLFGNDKSAWPQGTFIYALSDDYTQVTRVVKHFSANRYGPLESPTMTKVGGAYYVLGSRLTGWDTNPNVYTTSSSISGEWSDSAQFPPSWSNTLNMQVNAILKVKDKLIFMGDRWNPSDLNNSMAIWLPIRIQDGTVSLNWYDKWKIDEANNTVTGTQEGIGQDIKGLGSGRCLAINSSGTAVIEDCNGKYNQRWQLNKYNEIQLGSTQQCLDIDGRNKSRGARVDIYKCTGVDTQKWIISTVDSTIRSATTGLCLDVANRKTASGSPLTMWDCQTDASWQQWDMGHGTGSGSGQAHNIQGLGSGRCLAINAAGTAVIEDCSGAPEQRWQWNKYNEIRQESTQRCLDIDGRNKSRGARVDIYQCTGVDTQKWIVSAVDSTIRSATTGLCLDVANRNTAAGSPLTMWDCQTDASWQMWAMGN